MDSYHKEILALIQQRAGKATQHTFNDKYLGNEHPRYAINNPVMRSIASTWMREHRALSAAAIANMLTSLIHGKSSTEKCMAGILLDYTTPAQRLFAPKLFDEWLDHLIGWVEVDTLCTGKYTRTEIMGQWKSWRPLLVKFSKSKNIQKRRASIVFFCHPVRVEHDESLAQTALENIDRIKDEKEVLITKAISWVLRSMIKNYRPMVESYLEDNMDTLPKIAVRETMTKLKTGKKTR